MRFTTSFIFCIVFLSFFLSCKKGDQDPKISLLPRKERIARKWKMKKGSAYYNYYNFRSRTSFDGSTQQYISNNKIVKIPYTVDLFISKNGTFNFTETRDSHELIASGNWSFNSGIGEEKAKEKITFFITEVASGYTEEYFIFNRECVTFTYDIVRLTHKEMILYASDKQISFNQGDDLGLVIEYTFANE